MIGGQIKITNVSNYWIGEHTFIQDYLISVRDALRSIGAHSEPYIVALEKRHKLILPNV